jgi:hypothetical protein
LVHHAAVDVGGADAERDVPGGGLSTSAVHEPPRLTTRTDAQLAPSSNETHASTSAMAAGGAPCWRWIERLTE